MTCVIAVLIAFLTLTPSSEASTGTFLGADKLYHFVAFAALMLPCGLLPRRKCLPVFVAALLFGGGIELIQPLVGRTASVIDFLADGAGAASGLIFARTMVKKTELGSIP